MKLIDRFSQIIKRFKPISNKAKKIEIQKTLPPKCITIKTDSTGRIELTQKDDVYYIATHNLLNGEISVVDVAYDYHDANEKFNLICSEHIPTYQNQETI